MEYGRHGKTVLPYTQYNVENGRKQAGKIPPAPGRKLVISYFAVVTSVTVFAMVENTL